MSEHIPQQRRTRDVGVRRHRENAVTRGGERCHNIMRVIQVPLRFLTPGTVVLAAVPFFEVDEHKHRPVIVTAVEGSEVIALPCTTAAHGKPGYMPLGPSAANGLTRMSFVHLRPQRLPRPALVSMLGRLDDADFARMALLRPYAQSHRSRAQRPVA